MLFGTFEFIFVFLPLVFLGYYFIIEKTSKVSSLPAIFLVLASFAFYSWWNPVYLPILIGSIIANYFFGSLMNYRLHAKLFLYIGVSANLCLLGYFKYFGFFLENANFVFSTNILFEELLLPLGISFFTFQQIAYLIDCYRGRYVERDFIRYSLFVTFFPQLIAGPIVHHSEMMPQFKGRHKHKEIYEFVAKGIFVFSIGLFKKVVIADTFALWANAGFSNTSSLTLVDSWVSVFAYTFQLYFDFSGYADMAMGIALLFCIRLPINFNSPYKALNIRDFWRNWHMTLSRFLRDYVYIPLGGSKNGNFKTYRNLFLTFVLGGVWHGAGWNFFLWGAMHGIALIVFHVWSSGNIVLPKLFSWFITFLYVCLAWVFFRAETFQDAVNIFSAMIGLNGFMPNSADLAVTGNIDFFQYYSLMVFEATGKFELILSLLIAVFAFYVCFFSPNSIEKMEKFKPSYYRMFLCAASFLFSFLLMNSLPTTEFLYYDF
ncbi:MAG: MBOAT family protein [Gammaproteobacteria bacterium]|nr:MBOAT family protein [Gammaproteobacteria bacterium]